MVLSAHFFSVKLKIRLSTGKEWEVVGGKFENLEERSKIATMGNKAEWSTEGFLGSIRR